MSFRAGISLAILLASSRFGLAAQKPFSVYDDVLAFPQVCRALSHLWLAAEF